MRRRQDEDAHHGLAEEGAEIAAVGGDEVRGAGAERHGEDGPVLLAQLENRREHGLELGSRSPRGQRRRGGDAQFSGANCSSWYRAYCVTLSRVNLRR